MTVDDIKKMIEKYDKLCRPNIAFMNPEDAKMVKECLPDIEKEIVIAERPGIERGKCYIMERKELENWLFGSINNEFITRKH